MTQLFRLGEEQVARIRASFPREQGVKRVDGRKVLSGIVHGPRVACGMWMPQLPMNPTKNLTTISTVGQTTVPLT